MVSSENAWAGKHKNHGSFLLEFQPCGLTPSPTLSPTNSSVTPSPTVTGQTGVPTKFSTNTPTIKEPTTDTTTSPESQPQVPSVPTSSSVTNAPSKSSNIVAGLDCTLPDPVQIDTDLTLQQIANYRDNTFTMKLTYTGGQSWIGIGVNTLGKSKMVPAVAVIGRAQENDNGITSVSVLKYEMNSDAEDATGVIEMEEALQTLTDVSFVQTSTSSILTFTKRLNDEELSLESSNTWIYAVGLDQNAWQGRHTVHGSFQFEFSPCVVVPTAPPASIGQTVSPYPTITNKVASPNEGGLSGFSFFDTSKPNQDLWEIHGFLFFPFFLKIILVAQFSSISIEGMAPSRF